MAAIGGEFSDAVRAEVSGCLGLLAANDVAAALGRIRNVSGLVPEASLSSHLIGLASVRLGEPAKALDAFERAHAQAPETREHSEALGILHAKLGHIADSLYFGKLAIAATTELGLPDMLPEWLGSFADAFYRMTDAPMLREAERFLATGQRASALRFYRQATEIEPQSAPAWRGLASTALGTPAAAYRPGEGLVASRTLISLRDPSAQDKALHARLLAANGHEAEALTLAKEIAADPRVTSAVSYVPISLMARMSDVDEQTLANAATAFAQRFVFPLEPRTSEALYVERGAGRRLSLGVMSGDWGDGDWSKSGGLGTIVPVLIALDNARVSLTVYADDPAEGPLSRRLKQRADTWHDIAMHDDETLACVMANDRLDALIDLDGTIGCNRPAVFLARPAPLQLSLFGSADAAKALGFDSVIASSGDRNIIVPGGLSTLPADLPDDLLPLRDADNLIIGLSANAVATKRAAPMLAALLQQAPGTVLRLDRERLGGADLIAGVLDAFPAEVESHIQIATGNGHLVEYFAGIDMLIALPDDAYPDVGLAAAGLGLPVLTCRSIQLRASLLADWLESIGLGEWVASDRDSLVATATELVRGWAYADARQDTRERLAKIMRTERQIGSTRQATRLTEILQIRASACLAA